MIPISNNPRANTGFFDDLPFDDMDDAINAPKADIATVTFRPAAHIEVCKACRGSGQFYSYSGRLIGQCFKCKGKGKKAFVNSAATRERNRMAAHDRKENAKMSHIEVFTASHPDIAAWFSNSSFPFAVAMREAVEKYGSLTEKQLAASQRCVDSLAARIASNKIQAVTVAANAPSVDVSKLVTAFDLAATHLKFPKMVLGGFTITRAKPESRNPGALYFKTDNAVYLGKVMEGRFTRSKECQDDQQARIVDVCNDPKAAAIAYGLKFGICSCCGRELTNPESVARGIGPICASRFGW